MRALVLEGGAMRGIFTAGVLDAFDDNGEPPFDLVVGVSAGACCAASFLAGQYRRNYSVFLEHMTGLRFLNPLRALLGRSVVDMGYLLGPVTAESYPLDCPAIQAAPCRFEAVATNARTGEAAYLPAQGDDLLEALHATSAIPLLYRESPVEFRGERYFDGAASDPVPLGRALESGADDITVVFTRQPSKISRPPTPLMRRILALDLADYPQFREKLHAYDVTARRARDFLTETITGVRIRVLAPDDDFPVGRFSYDRAALHAGYMMGRRAATAGGVVLGE